MTDSINTHSVYNVEVRLLSLLFSQTGEGSYEHVENSDEEYSPHDEEVQQVIPDQTELAGQDSKLLTEQDHGQTNCDLEKIKFCQKKFSIACIRIPFRMSVSTVKAETVNPLYSL